MNNYMEESNQQMFFFWYFICNGLNLVLKGQVDDGTSLHRRCLLTRDLKRMWHCNATYN